MKEISAIPEKRGRQLNWNFWHLTKIDNKWIVARVWLEQNETENKKLAKLQIWDYTMKMKNISSHELITDCYQRKTAK